MGAAFYFESNARGVNLWMKQNRELKKWKRLVDLYVMLKTREWLGEEKSDRSRASWQPPIGILCERVLSLFCNQLSGLI